MGSVEVSTYVTVNCGAESPAPTGSPVPPTPSPNARVFTRTLGDGLNTVFTVAHGLGSSDVLASVRSVLTGVIGQGDPVVTVTSPNEVTISFPVPPITDEYRVVVLAVS
jgi:hypothetical protein